MIELLSWVALVCVIMQLWKMGSHKYRVGWYFSLAACVSWGVYSVSTEAWALLGQQAVIAGLAVRALINLEG